jgi:hypothetical protein
MSYFAGAENEALLLRRLHRQALAVPARARKPAACAFARNC